VDVWLFVLSSLATCQLAETFRHGSIFSGIRAKIEAQGAMFSEWINCGFCFSHTAAFVITICALFNLAAHSYGYIVNPFNVLIFWLASVRCANLLNDITKPYSRTPSRDGLVVEELDPDK